ncbi:hypothetical protein [Tunturiibacter gelidiferens]|uniref:hypothetical protein n=1 Tax=Tunturiibacter gelidiferens TaxID=3069689 RepID=UPI003D9B46E9
MTSQKKTRLVLICLIIFAAILFGPMFLFMASNAGAAVLDLVLNRKPTGAELLGNYKIQVPWGNATLRIDADGTFLEEINENGKPAKSVSGRWQSSDGQNFVTLDFRPFGMVWDEDHASETSIYGINFYKPHFGTTYGLIDDDLGEKFERQ